MTSIIDGVTVPEAYERRVDVELGDVVVPFISMPDLAPEQASER